jgi:hypothetical protein
MVRDTNLVIISMPIIGNHGVHYINLTRMVRVLVLTFFAEKMLPHTLYPSLTGVKSIDDRVDDDIPVNYLVDV